MSAEQPLPRSWTETTLDSLLHRIEAGLNVKCEERPPNLGEKGLVKISAVTWGQFDELQSKTLPASETPVPSNRIQPGDLLISRANTIELVGSSVIVKELQRELYLSDKVLRLVVHEPSKRWINYALKTPALRKAIEDGSSGNQLSMRNISQEKLKALPLPLAPEAEQKRIADKLDTVSPRVDAVNTRLARVAPLLKRFRQSVLAAATSGRLTEDWRAGQPDISEWKTEKLNDLGELGRGKSKHRPRNDPRLYGGVHPFVQTGDVANANQWITSHKQTYSDFGLDQSKLWPANTLCITIAANIADTALLSYPACFPDSVVGFVANEACCLPRFIKWSIDVRKDDLERLAPATAQKNINLGVLEEVEIHLPSLEEQTEIVRRVETLFAFADRLEARLAQAQTAATRLTPALLAKAFRGELVPQDPNDEPAAELLRRLQAQRATAPKASAGRGRKAAVRSEG